MANSMDLFDSDMIETSLINYNPMHGIKNKIPWVDKYRPKNLNQIVQQEEVVKVLKESLKTGQFTHMLFFGPPGTGKCLKNDTLVIMYDGKVVQAQNIKVGDQLMGDDNTPRTVVGTTTGEDTMYRIIQGKGDNYEVNSEHIICLKLSYPFAEKWSEKENRYKLIWFYDHKLNQKSFSVKAGVGLRGFFSKEQAKHALNEYKKKLIIENLVNSKGDIIDISIQDYLKKTVDWKRAYKGFKSGAITCWPKQEVDMDPYMLGYWLGDGGTTDNSITSQDATVLKYFRDEVPKMGNIYLKWSSKYDYRVTCGIIDGKSRGKNQFRNALNKYNLFDNKHVPDDYKHNDFETRCQLLAGFLDADGHMNNKGYNYFEFCQKSKKVFDDIVFVARSLGLIASVIKSKVVDGVGYHRANIYGKGLEKIPTKIQRKLAVKYGHNKDPSVYEISVKELPRGKYCGFELDGNGRFLLGDFTVTHNTSSILSFAMELFGPNIFDRRVIELNASDERGINVVRNKIITFAKSAVGNPDPKYPSPPYKIIILDEADAMTMEAQSALRTVMESLSGITRFCFICNYINQIIDPIASRCMKFRFKSIDKTTMVNKLKNIATNEKFVVPDDVYDKIVELSKGDIRSGIITLQYLKYIYDYQGSLSVKDIFETTNYLPNAVINEIWERCIDNKNSTVNDAKKDALLLKQKGYSINSILEKLNCLVINCNKITDEQKSLISINLSETEKRLVDGADEYIQLLNILGYTQAIFHNRIKFEN